MSTSLLSKALLSKAIHQTRLLSTVAILSAAVVPYTSADTNTGHLKGSLLDSNQERASNTVVSILDVARGQQLKSSVSDSSNFSFRNLRPGKYLVKVLSGGAVIESQEVVITLGSTTNVRLGGGNIEEEVIVHGEATNLSDSSIAETGLVITAETLNTLPISRDLSSVSLLAPGVSLGDSRFPGTTSFAGASVAENTSYINGLNTTNFRKGLGFSQVPFEFYDTIQVKTGGYSAKFGRSTGGVLNATTKSGSNEFTAGANTYFSQNLSARPNSFRRLHEDDENGNNTFEGYASGAIIKDRLFYYALASHSETMDEYSSLELGRRREYDENSDFWGLKIDGYISEGHRVELTAFSDERDNIAAIYSLDSNNNKGDYVGDRIESFGGTNWIATYVGEVTNNVQVSASIGENAQDRSIVPSTQNIPYVETRNYDTNNWNVSSGAANRLVENGQDTREMARFDVTWTLGDHLLELGLDYENNVSSQNSFYSGQQWWQLDPQNQVFLCDTDTECPQGSVAQLERYNVQGEFKTRSNAYYIQDTWQVTDTLSVALGLRNDAFTNYNGDGEKFIEMTNQWAPRLSASWDITGDGKQTVFSHFGQYYLPVASNTNIRLAGPESQSRDLVDWDGSCLNPDGSPCNLGDAYSNAVFSDGQVPDTRSKVDTQIEPMFQSEFILGYEYEMDSGIQLGVRGIYRRLESSIEDIAIDAGVINYYNSNPGAWTVEGQTVEEVFAGFHQYVLANPGKDMEIYIPETDEFINLTAEQLGYPDAERQYSALEFTFGRPFDGKWLLDGSYVWAHSWGNNEGYVRSDNGQDDAGLTTNFDQPGLTDFGHGDLPNDRRHTLKARGIYTFTDAFSIGANGLVQTGRPRNCFGVHPTDEFAALYGAASFYCGGNPVPRASLGTTDTFWNIDLNAQYKVSLPDNHQLTFSLDLFNLFNNDTVTQVEEEGELAANSPNPNFGLPRDYQAPRSVRLSARYQFN